MKGARSFATEFEDCLDYRHRVAGSVQETTLDILVVGAGGPEPAVDAALARCGLDPGLASQLHVTVGAEQLVASDSCAAGIVITTEPPEGAVVIGDPAEFNDLTVVCGIATVTTTTRQDGTFEIPVTLREIAPVPTAGPQALSALGLLLLAIGISTLQLRH